MHVMLLHAHPDDEILCTGGSISAWLNAGHQVTIVTATLGEEGEVFDPALEKLRAHATDTLGEYRRTELAKALQVIGQGNNRLSWAPLGGEGAWRDSGMPPEGSPLDSRCLVRNVEAASENMAQLVATHSPDIVLSYDQKGGYGHPDHRACYRLLRAALAEQPVATGFFGHTLSGARRCEEASPELVRDISQHVPAHIRVRPPRKGELPGYPESQFTHRVALSARDQQMRAQALAAHASQVVCVSAQAHDWFVLTNGVIQPLDEAEYYRIHNPANIPLPAFEVCG